MRVQNCYSVMISILSQMKPERRFYLWKSQRQNQCMSVAMTYSHLYPSKQRKMADKLNQDHEREE